MRPFRRYMAWNVYEPRQSPGRERPLRHGPSPMLKLI
jgi:hypothetical protein